MTWGTLTSFPILNQAQVDELCNPSFQGLSFDSGEGKYSLLRWLFDKRSSSLKLIIHKGKLDFKWEVEIIFLILKEATGVFRLALPRCPAISACARRWGRTCQQRSRDKDTFAPPARIFQARPWKSVFSSSIHVDRQPLGTLATVGKWVDMSIESKYSMADGENKNLFQRKV